MYEIVETANGWILRPAASYPYDRPYPMAWSDVYVFVDIAELNKHLRKTLKTIAKESDKK